MALVNVTLPSAGQVVIIDTVKANDKIVLNFAASDAIISRSATDLTFTSADGGIVIIKNFVSLAAEPHAPSIVMDGQEVDAQLLLQRIDEDLPVTAAGPAAAMGGGRFHEDITNSPLIDGVDALRGLGTTQWERNTSVRTELDDKPTADAAGKINLLPSLNSLIVDLTEDSPTDSSRSGDALTGAVFGDGGGSFQWVDPTRESQYGTLVRSPDGSFTYTLNNSLASVQALGAGETVTETFSYSYTDKDGDTAQGTLTIVIHGTNDSPTVTAATASVTEDLVLTANGTLPTPTDVDTHDTLSFVSQTAAPGQYGSLTLDASGAYTYSLNNSLAAVQALGVGEHLTDTFTYTVSDGHGGTATNTLTITINGTNDIPTVAAATDAVTEDTQITTSGTLPTPTDVDAHDSPVFIPQTETSGSYGSFTVNAAGQYSYTLNNSLPTVQALGVGEHLTETFTYTVSDGHGGTATNTLTITINGTNDIPTVAAATDSVTEDTQTVASGTLPTPADIDIHDVLTFTTQTNAPGTYGSLTVNAAGEYSYALNNNLEAVQALGVGEHLTDTFTYTVSDGHGGTATNTLTITINGTNDLPTVAAATDSVTEDIQSEVSGTLPTPADVDVHDSPVFIPQTAAPGSYGSFTVDAAGHYFYTLNNNLESVQALGVGEHLTDTFIYTVSDGHGGTATNTLTITINGTNDIPTVAAATDAVTEDTQTVASGTLPVPTDVDIHDVLTFTTQTNAPGAYGSLTVNATGQYSYTLNNNLESVQALGVGEHLTDTFTYTVSDGHGGTATNTLTITINGTNDIPTVAAATDSVTEDTQSEISGTLPTPADVDVHDSPVFIPQTAAPGSYGSFTVDAAGHYFYTLNNNLESVQALGVGEHLTDTFTYTVSDGHGGTATNTLTITINGTNDIPTVAAATDAVTEDTQITASGTLPTPADVDIHDTLTFAAQTNAPGTYGSLTVNAAGQYSYTLNNNLESVQALGVGEHLTDTFTYTVSDGHGGTATNTMTITINGTNDAPVVAAATDAVTEDTQITTSGTLPTPTDIDIHDTPVFIAQTEAPGSYGSFTVNAAGQYSYALNNSLASVQALGVGEHLTDTFTYTVSDGHGGTATNTLTITINGTNDAPVVAAATDSVTEDTQITTSGTLPTPTDIDVHDTPVFIAQTATPGSYGNFTVNAAGQYSYSLNNSLEAVQGLGVGEHLTDTFTYTVSDGHGGTATNTMTVTINGTNDAPVVAAATDAVTEDTALTASGTLPTPTDVDIHDTPVFVPQAATSGAYGSFTVNAAGAYVYTLNNSLESVQALGVGEHLTDTFTYTVSDGHGGTATNTLTITINGTNDIPTVAAATDSVTEDTQISASGTLPTPADVDVHDTLTFAAQTNAPGAYGSLTVNAAGAYTYALDNNLEAVQALGVGEHLTDTFTYTVSDGHGGTATNTLTITINGTNDIPTVAAATDAVTEDTQITASGTLPTPADVDIHDTLTFAAQTNAPGAYGSLTVNAAGEYSYSLNNSLTAVQALGVGEHLTDTFTYTVSDGHGGTATNTLTITINGTNDIPTVAAATDAVTEDTQITASGTLPTPADVDIHDTLTFAAQTNAPGTYGSLTVNAAGVYTYALDNNLEAVQALGVGEHLTDTFTYTVSDGHAGTATNTLTITINGTNDAPVVAAATDAVTEDTQVTTSGTLPTPTDVDVHDSPVFIPQTATSGSYGSFTVNASGQYSYALNNSLASVQALGVGEHLTDTFTYTVSDGHGGTATNTLTITINGTNDIPTVAAATDAVTEDTQITANGTLPTPTDIDIHDTLTFAAQTNAPGTYGSLTVNAAGEYSYALNNNLESVQALGVGEHLTDTFTYTVSDGHGGTATNTLTITINGTNDAPVVAAATDAVTEDTQITATGTLPTPTDIDIHDTPVFIPQPATSGSYGSFTVNAAGQYSYALNNSLAEVQALGVGEHLTDTFTYTVSDGHGGTATNTLTITINGTNDIPTVAAATDAVTEDTHTVASGTLPAPADIDIHDVLTFTTQTNAPGDYGSLTVNASGAYTYNLNNSLAAVQGLGVGEHLTDTFTYTVNDGHGGTATNTLTITINGTNDAPVVAAATDAVTEDTQTSTSGILPAPTDVDIHDAPVFVPQTAAPGSYGSFSLNAAGAYTYNLNNSLAAVQALGVGEHLTDTFTYTVSDGHGGTGTNTLTVTINGTNDAPAVSAATTSVTEDTQITATGTLPAPTDADIHDTPVFTPQTAAPGSYGSFTVNSAGVYSYTLNNSLASVQALGVGEHLTDTFTYTVSDGHGGTASNTLTVTINGTNDIPTVGAATASVTEDTQTVASGILPTPTDVDIHDTLLFVPQTAAPGSYGSFNLNAAGAYTYNLNNSLASVQALGVGEHLTDTFTYTVSDGHGGTATNTLTVTINGTNDAPVVSAATASVTEDTAITATGTLPAPTDADIHDTPVFTPQTAAPGSYGSFTVNSAGVYSYTLNNSLASVQALGVGEHLTDTFTYTVSDGHGGTATNTLTVTINGTNDIPTVGAATASVTEDTQTVASGILPTPTDVDSHDTLLFVPQTAAPGSYGSFSLNAAGAYTYNLNNSLAAVQALGIGEKLTDTFTYTVSDGHGGTATNTLTVTINGTNDAPVVGAATASVTEDTAITATGTLPAPTDVDIHDTPVFIPKTAAPGSYGSLTLNSAGVYTYSLNNSLAAVQALGVGEKLTDTFTYTVSDGHGGTATNTLTVTINGTNDAPVVSAATASVTEDTQTFTTGILPTPTDVDIHDTPVFVPQTAASGSYGSFNLNAAGAYTYNLNNNLAAVQALGVGEKLTDTFTYTVSDGHGGTATNTLTVTINGTNDIPTVGAATASVTEDTKITATGTLPTPVDVDIHDTLLFTTQTNAPGAYGKLTLAANGNYTYTLTNTLAAVQGLGVGETLTDTFTYTVNDGHGGTATNTLTVTINGTNDAPVVSAATASVTEDTTLTATGTLPTPTDVDIHDATPLFVPQTAAPGSYGSFTVNSAGVYSYTLNNSLAAVQALGVGEKLTDTFTYTVTDSHGATGTNTITVTINGTNDIPTVAAATASVNEDTKITATGTLPTPVDVDIHDTLLFTTQTNAPGAYGKLTLAANGNYTYTLTNTLAAVQQLGVGETLTDTFTYTVNDGHGGTATNTLTVTINGTNDAPVVSAATASVTEDTTLTATGTLPTPTDVDIHDTPVFVPQTAASGSYGSFTVNSAGVYSYTLNNSLAAVQALGVGEKLTDTFTYTVTDGHGGTGTNTLTVTINGTNDIPTVAAATASVTEDTKLTATGTLPTPVDVDIHDTLLFTTQTNTPGAYGKLTLAANGTYTYTLTNTLAAVQQLGVGETLTDTFTYTANDGHGGTATNTLTVTINGTNDKPVVAAATNSVTEDTVLTASGTLPTPTDVDIHDSPTFVALTNKAGSYGTLNLNTAGVYTYTLNNSLAAVQRLGVGETLTETFTYTVTDGHTGGTGTNTLKITINGTNDIPTVAASTASVTEDTQITATGSLPTPVDVDIHDVLTFTAQTNAPGTYGSFTVNAAGSYTYTLNNNLAAVQALGVGEKLTDTFTYTVNDGHGGTATNTMTVTINGTNDAPVVAAATASVTEDTILTATGTLPAPTDVDIHDTPVFIPKTAAPGSYGSLTLNAAGVYTYSLNNSLAAVQALGVGEKLTDTFTYTVSDGHGGTGTNTLTITINGTNDAPVVGGATASVTEDTKTVASGTLPAPTDIDIHDTPVFIAQTATAGSYGSLTLNAAGAYTYNLNNNLTAVQALGVGEHLTDTFTYTVSDGHGGTGTNTITVTINGTNDNPVVAAATASVTEDTLVTTSGVLPTPTDVDIHDILAFTPINNLSGVYGTFTLGANGAYTYNLNNNLPSVQALGVGEHLTDTFIYTVTDGHGGSTTNTMTVTINGTNDLPTVGSATNSAAEDLVLSATGRLPTPQDVDTNDNLTFVPQTAHAGIYGSLNLAADGTYTYTLNNSSSAVQGIGVGETALDTFTYTVSDGHGGFVNNTLTISVTGRNDSPTLTSATTSVTEDTQTTVTGTLPAPHDADIHDTTSFIPKAAEAGLYGTLTIGANGTYTYVLNNNLAAVQHLGVGESLTETFTYVVLDNHGSAASASLTVTINGTNDAPNVTSNTGSVSEDTALTTSGNLSSADIDTHDTVTFTPVVNQQGLYGTLTVNANGSYTYTLNNNLAAVQGLGVGEQLHDVFQTVMTDNHGASSINTLNIAINGTNDIPTVGPASASVTEDTSTIAQGQLPTPADVDVHDVDTFTPLNVSGNFGSIAINAQGAYVYTLNNNLPIVQSLGVGAHLSEQFTYVVSDGHGGVTYNTLNITINGTNDAPQVGATVVNDPFPGAALTGVLATPTDIDTGDVVKFVQQENIQGTYGTLHLNVQGHYTYVVDIGRSQYENLAPGQTLTEQFQYSVSDGHGGTAQNTLTIILSPPSHDNGNSNDFSAVAASDSVTEDLVTETSGQIPNPKHAHGNVEYQPASLTGVYGHLTVNSDGTYTYTLNNSLDAVQSLGNGQQLTESFNYSVTSGGETASSTIAITINGTNDAPVVSPVVTNVTEDASTVAVGKVLVSDVDDNDQILTFTPKAGEAGSYGTLILNANGTYSYILNNSSSVVQGLGVGETLTDVFTVTGQDQHGGSGSATLSVVIHGTNDTPYVAAASAQVVEDTQPFVSGTLPTPHDVDIHDVLTITPQQNITGQYGTFNINANGTYSYTLNNALPVVQGLGTGESLSDSLNYVINDGHGGVITNTLTIRIQGTNDAPTGSSFTGQVKEDGVQHLSGILPAPVDPDTHDTPHYTAMSATGVYGSITIGANGYYSYVLNNASQAVQALSAGDTATEVFTYTVSDGHGGSSTNTFTVTINGTNDVPLIASAHDSVTSITDPTAGGTLPTPVDVDAHDVLTFTPINNLAGVYGTLSVDSHGVYSYVLNDSSPLVQGLGVGETATETFSYTVNDGHGGTATNTLTITVNGTNDAPVAVASIPVVTEDVILVASGSLPPPTDADIHDTDSFVPQTNTQGLYGTLSISPTGVYSYVLNNTSPLVQGLGAGEQVVDTFTYRVIDNHGAGVNVVLNVLVNGSNDIPVVAAATAAVTEDTVLSSTGNLPTPTDVDIHDVLTFTPITAQVGLYGTLSVNAAGHYTYTLANNSTAVQGLGVGETATDTFTYTVNDGHGGTATNTLTVTVTGTNDTPLVAPATASVTEDTILVASGSLPVPVDADAHDTVSFIPINSLGGQYGTLSVDSAGHYTYTLNNSLPAVQALGVGETATETFTYTISDNHGATSTNTLTVTVNGKNDVPTVAAASASVTEDTNIVATGTLPVPHDVDTHDTVTFNPVNALTGSYGSLSIDAAGHYTYTLANNSTAVQRLGVGETATDTFTYAVNDGHGGIATNTLTVTVTGTNDTPLVAAAADSVTEDALLVASGSLPTPVDVDAHDTVSFTPINSMAGQYGTLNVDSAGHYTYTLNNSLAAVQALGAGESATEIFTYTVVDNHGATSTNVLTLTVNGSNDIPTVDAASTAVTEDTNLVATGVLPAPHDIDIHDTLTFTPINALAGSYGSLSVDSGGHYTYTLANSSTAVQSLGVGETAIDTFTYTVNDGHGGTATNTLSITVTGTNDSPVVTPATASVTEDTILVASGSLPTPVDVDAHDTVSFIPINSLGGQYGTLSVDNAGHYTYTLNNSLAAVQALGSGETATDTFTYTVTDNHGATSTNTLTLTVNGTNDIPTVDAASANVTENTNLIATGALPTPHDVDVHDVLTFHPINALAGNYGSLDVDSSGHYTYTLANDSTAVQNLGSGDTATDTFHYTVDDGHGGTATNTLTITIQGDDAAPMMVTAFAAASMMTVSPEFASYSLEQDINTHILNNGQLHESTTPEKHDILTGQGEPILVGMSDPAHTPDLHIGQTSLLGIDTISAHTSGELASTTATGESDSLKLHDVLSADTSLDTLLPQADKHAETTSSDSTKDATHTDTTSTDKSDAQVSVMQEHVHTPETADTALEQEIQEHIVRNHSS